MPLLVEEPRDELSVSSTSQVVRGSSDPHQEVPDPRRVLLLEQVVEGRSGPTTPPGVHEGTRRAIRESLLDEIVASSPRDDCGTLPHHGEKRLSLENRGQLCAVG